MQGTQRPSREIVRTIGQLCFGGDWACANGDVSALRHVAQRLADYMPEPEHCELLALADQCLGDPDHAIASWQTIKPRLFRGER